MWICFNDAYLSIVEPSPADKKEYPNHLLVRARRKGDIEAVFGDDVKVEKRPERDYLFRTYLPREFIGGVIASRVMTVDYPNFKNSVKNGKLHDAYARIWSIMAALQPTRPYSGRSGQRDML